MKRSVCPNEKSMKGRRAGFSQSSRQSLSLLSTTLASISANKNTLRLSSGGGYFSRTRRYLGLLDFDGHRFGLIILSEKPERGSAGNQYGEHKNVNSMLTPIPCPGICLFLPINWGMAFGRGRNRPTGRGSRRVGRRVRGRNRSGPGEKARLPACFPDRRSD